MQQIPYSMSIIEERSLGDPEGEKCFDHAMRFKAWAIANKYNLSSKARKAIYEEEKERCYDSVSSGDLVLVHGTAYDNKMSVMDIAAEVSLYADCGHPTLIVPGEATEASITQISTISAPVGFALTIVPELIQRLFPWIQSVYTFRPMAYILSNQKCSDKYRELG